MTQGMKTIMGMPKYGTKGITLADHFGYPRFRITFNFNRYIGSDSKNLFN
jgi:hypothetical protein